MEAHEMLRLILSNKIKPSVRQRLDEQVPKGKCCATDEDAKGKEIRCNEDEFNKGACRRHYYRWYNPRRGMTDEQKILYDNAAVAAGQILPPNGKSKYRNQNIMTRIARRVRKVS